MQADMALSAGILGECQNSPRMLAKAQDMKTGLPALLSCCLKYSCCLNKHACKHFASTFNALCHLYAVTEVA